MQSAEHLLQFLDQDGFELHLEGGGLYIRPASRLTDEHRTAIRIHKEQLCQMLAQRMTPSTNEWPKEGKTSTDPIDSQIPDQTPSQPPSPSFTRVRLIKTVPRHNPPERLVAGAIMPVYPERLDYGAAWVQCPSGNWAKLEGEYWEPIFD